MGALNTDGITFIKSAPSVQTKINLVHCNPLTTGNSAEFGTYLLLLQ
jgi:hypothetical protein